MTNRLANRFASAQAVELAKTDIAFARTCRLVIRQGMSLKHPEATWLDWAVDDLAHELGMIAREAVAVLRENGVPSSEWKH